MQGDLFEPSLHGVIPRAIDNLFASLARDASALSTGSTIDSPVPGSMQLSLSYLVRLVAGARACTTSVHELHCIVIIVLWRRVASNRRFITSAFEICWHRARTVRRAVWPHPVFELYFICALQFRESLNVSLINFTQFMIPNAHSIGCKHCRPTFSVHIISSLALSTVACGWLILVDGRQFTRLTCAGT